MEKEDKAAKDKARERSQAMALRGRGFRFRHPCPGWPPEYSLPPLSTRQHCPFKYHVATPGPFFPVLQPAQTPPALKATLLQWTSPATHPPAPLSHLPTPPYPCSLAPFSTFTPNPSPDLQYLEPVPQSRWDIAPSPPTPSCRWEPAQAQYAPPWKRSGLSVPRPGWS